MPDVTKRWRAARRKDKYYRKAKREHYRSRAVYKLKQIDYKYDLLRPGDTVVDLGASPGGWSQVAAELVGAEGKVVAADMDRMTPIEGVAFVRGDIREKAIVDRILGLLPEGVDVVISDMSPDISGNYPYDHARSIELCEHAFRFAEEVLKDDGNFVCKMFSGDMSQGFVGRVRRAFDETHIERPRASRAASSEVYVIGLGYRPRRG